MKTGLIVGMVVLLAALSGCETKSSDAEGTNKTEFIFVNTRNVPEEMDVTLRKNGAFLDAKTIAYASDANRSVFWNDGDELRIEYSQDIPEISRVVPLHEGKIAYIAIGNAQGTYSSAAPVMILAPDKSELSFTYARILILNAMVGDVKKIVINNNEESELLSFASLSSPLDADVEINGIADVEIQDVNESVITSVTFDMDNNNAYLMVIYEDNTTLPAIPQIKLLDITP